MEAWKNNNNYQEYYKTLLENNIPEKIIDKTFLELSHKNYFYTLDLKQQLSQLQQEKEELIEWLKEEIKTLDKLDERFGKGLLELVLEKLGE